MPIGSCVKCGYLGHKTRFMSDNPGFPTILEVGEEQRNHATFHPNPWFEHKPLCVKRVEQFTELILHPDGNFHYPLLEKEWDCPGFTPWQQGFTPKEHREMMDRERLLEFQTKREDGWQKFQAQMIADDKKWREEQEAKAETRHQTEMATMRGINRTQMLILGFLVTAAIVVATLTGSAIQAGWFPKWFGIGESVPMPTPPSTPGTGVTPP